MEQVFAAVVGAVGLVIVALITARTTAKISRSKEQVISIDESYKQVIATLRDDLARVVSERDKLQEKIDAKVGK